MHREISITKLYSIPLIFLWPSPLILLLVVRRFFDNILDRVLYKYDQLIYPFSISPWNSSIFSDLNRLLKVLNKITFLSLKSFFSTNVHRGGAGRYHQMGDPGNTSRYLNISTIAGLISVVDTLSSASLFAFRQPR